MPRFSIIIPAYNLANYLADCIESIYRQSFRDFEVVVVDDGSADRTAEVCEGLLLAHPGLRLIRKLSA